VLRFVRLRESQSVFIFHYCRIRKTSKIYFQFIAVSGRIPEWVNKIKRLAGKEAAGDVHPRGKHAGLD
jgi:hypothetical protein